MSVFLLVVSALSAYVSVALIKARVGLSFPAVMSVAVLVFATYTQIHTLVCFIYFLYIDKRDIQKVLESQVDYGVQRNIWPR